jgi:hypothetical protein
MAAPAGATGPHGAIPPETGSGPASRARPADLAVPAGRPPSWAWRLLRVYATVQAVDAILQPVFEGRFLSGDYAMLAAHSSNGIAVGVLSISQIAVAVVAWRVSRLPSRIVVAMAALGAATALQIALGFSRNLGVHIPLGVAIIAGSARLAAWTWTHGPGHADAAGRPAASRATP